MFACRLCGEKELDLYYTQGNVDEFKFYRCRHCGLVNYDLATGLNQAKYALEYPDPLDGRLKVNRDQTRSAEFLAKHVPRGGRLLEIGCGNGRLLHLAREAGWQVRGLELSSFMADSIKKTLGIDVICADFLKYSPENDAYDVAVLRHVLEHLPDSIAALKSINRLLKPGGLALLEFPNIDAIDMNFKRLLRRTKLHRKKYAADYKPGHCNEFSRKSFDYLISRSGFKMVAWQTYSSKQVPDLLYNRIPIGNKVRTLIRKESGV